LHILRVRCRNRKEFDEHYVARLPNGGVFCPTTTELAAGTAVVVELMCDGLPNKVLIRGSVTGWRPALPRMRVRAGATVEFAPDEAAKRDFVLETLKGDRQVTPRRRHARIPIGVPVRFRLESELEWRPSELREISVNGALVSASLQPSVGTDVVLEIAPPGSAAPMALSGRVIYHSGTDQTGIKFLYREGGGSRRLRELVRRFKSH